MKSGNILLTVIGAAAAGYVAGLLTAPKSGKETRKEIKTKAQEVGKDLQGFKDDTLESIKKKAEALNDEITSN